MKTHEPKPLSQSAIAKALYLAENGYRVFAVKPYGKEPATRQGCKDATRDTDLLTAMFCRDDFNIGIATDGLLVVDVDNTECFKELLDSHGVELPDNGMQVQTGKGLHIYFQGESKNRVNVSGCFDIRGTGGYVLAPGSTHPSGAIYKLLTPFRSAGALPPPPDWLSSLLKPTEPVRACVAPIQVSGNVTRYGLAALRKECDRVATAPTGTRNHALNQAAFSIGSLVAAGALSEVEAANNLVAAARAAGLPDPEIRKTVISGMRSGIQKPREVARHG